MEAYCVGQKEVTASGKGKCRSENGVRLFGLLHWSYGIFLRQRLFGSRNELFHHFFTHIFVWFVKWNRLIHHHLISDKLILRMRNRVIPLNLRNGLIPPNLKNRIIMHHLIQNGVIYQTKHPINLQCLVSTLRKICYNIIKQKILVSNN